MQQLTTTPSQTLKPIKNPKTQSLKSLEKESLFKKWMENIHKTPKVVQILSFLEYLNREDTGKVISFIPNTFTLL